MQKHLFLLFAHCCGPLSLLPNQVATSQCDTVALTVIVAIPFVAHAAAVPLGVREQFLKPGPRLIGALPALSERRLCSAHSLAAKVIMVIVSWLPFQTIIDAPAFDGEQ